MVIKMPETTDLPEPYMPAVDVRPDMRAVFVDARVAVANPDPKAGLASGQRCLGILTPGRMVMIVPAPKLGAVPDQFVEQVKQLLPTDRPLKIAAVSFIELNAFIKGGMPDKLKCIPNLPQLIGLAFVGHNIIVFEGHPSAFEFALPDSDVLLIDSGMLPLLQGDWAELAFRAMPEGRRILVYDRKTRALRPVIKSKIGPGWRYGEPDGEASYANCLLTTLAKRNSVAVEVTAGQATPDLSMLAVDPKEIEWTVELPFTYERLDAAKVIDILRRFAKLGDAASGKLEAKLATGGGKLESVAFALHLTKDAEGRQRLKIEKAA